MRFSAMALATLLVIGCSNRAVYDNIQLNNRYACAEKPPSEQDACYQNASKTYDEYERERQEALQQD
ncbi:MAG: hypothetical protein MI864_06010 [Pseudomonadales bacterium]|nr:hypothetical protein [Pseudomonadales bacterium]